jgi:hypothetical protein
MFLAYYVRTANVGQGKNPNPFQWPYWAPKIIDWTQGPDLVYGVDIYKYFGYL